MTRHNFNNTSKAGNSPLGSYIAGRALFLLVHF
jgi:hypothetical protein